MRARLSGNGGATDRDGSACREDRFRDSLEGADFARKLNKFEFLSHAPPYSSQRSQRGLTSPNQGRKSFSVNVSAVVPAGTVVVAKPPSPNVNAARRAGVGQPRISSPPPLQPVNGFADRVTNSSCLRAPNSPVPRRRELGNAVVYGASPTSPFVARRTTGNTAASASPSPPRQRPSPIIGRSPAARITPSTSGEDVVAGDRFLFRSPSPSPSPAESVRKAAPPVPTKPTSRRSPGRILQIDTNASASPETPSRNQLITASKLRSARIEISPPRTVETVVTKTILVNGSPPKNAVVNGSPPNNAVVSGSPPRNAVVNGSPPRNAVVSGSPPRNAVVSGSPPRNAVVSGSPPKNAVVSGSPPRNAVVSGSPPRNADNVDLNVCLSSSSRPPRRLNLPGSAVCRPSSPSYPCDGESRAVGALRHADTTSSRSTGSPSPSPVRVVPSSPSSSQQRSVNGSRNVVLVPSDRSRVALTGRRDAASPTASLSESLGALNLENFKGEKLFTRDTAVTRVQLVASPSSATDRPSEFRRPTSPYTFVHPASPIGVDLSTSESRALTKSPSSRHRSVANVQRSMTSTPLPPFQRGVVPNGPSSTATHTATATSAAESAETLSSSGCSTASGVDVITLRTVSPVASPQSSKRHAVSIYDNVSDYDGRSEDAVESLSRTERVMSTASSSSFTSVSSMSSCEPPAVAAAPAAAPAASSVDSQSPPASKRKTFGVKVLPTSLVPPSSPSAARRAAQQLSKSFSEENSEFSRRDAVVVEQTRSGTIGLYDRESVSSGIVSVNTTRPLLNGGARGKTSSIAATSPGNGKSVTFVLEDRCGDIDIREADAVSLDSLEMTEDELTASQQDLRQQHAFQRQERRREQAQAVAERQRLEDILAMCEEYERELEREMKQQTNVGNSNTSNSSSAPAKAPPSFSRTSSVRSDSSTPVASTTSSPITGRSPNATTNRIKTNGSLNKMSPTPQHREVGSFDFWRRRSSNSSASEEDCEGTIKRRPTAPRPIGELHVVGDRFAEHQRLAVGSSARNVKPGDASHPEWLDCLDSGNVDRHANARRSAGAAAAAQHDRRCESALQSSSANPVASWSKSTAAPYVHETRQPGDCPSQPTTTPKVTCIGADENARDDVSLQVKVTSASSDAPRSPAGSDGSSDTPSGGTNGNDAVTASSSGVETSSEHGSLTNSEESEARGQLVKLVVRRGDCVRKIGALKQKISDIESQQNENILELEMERALLEGEHQTEMGELQAEQKRISFLKKRQLQLIEAACSERDKEQSLIESEREALQSLEADQRAIKRQLETAGTDRNKLVQEIGQLQEQLDSRRKKFDDLEFQQLEVETRYEEEREKVQRLLTKEQNDMLDKYRLREEKLHSLDVQQREMLLQVKSEMESLELNRQTLVDQFRQQKKQLSALEAAIRETQRRQQTLGTADHGHHDHHDGSGAGRGQHDSTSTDLLNLDDANLKTPEERSFPQLMENISSFSVSGANSGISGRSGIIGWSGISGRSGELAERQDDDSGDSSDGEPDPQRHVAERDRNRNRKSSASQQAGEALELERRKRIELERQLREETDRRDEMIEQQIRLRQTSNTQARPLTRYLPVRNVELDLRRHVESAGHALDAAAAASAVFVDATSCRGFLQKMGAKFRNWNRRWFVFDRRKRTLSYFVDRTETRVRGAIYFQAIEEVYVDHQRTVKSPNPKLTFCVKTRDRFYYLLAPTAEAMRVWIDVVFTGAEGYREYLDT